MMPNQFDFFNEDDSVKLEWVSDKAEKFAKNLSYPNNTAREKGISSSQLRNFYNEFLRIRDLPKGKEEKFALIKLLYAKIKYKKTSRPNEIKTDFVNFIKELVNQIGTSEKRFNNACLIMEAIVGYFPKK